MVKTRAGAKPKTSSKCLLLNLPLELRHKIYGYSAQRPTGTDLILKEYLEKMDPQIENPSSGEDSEDLDDMLTEDEEDLAASENEGDSEEEEGGNDGIQAPAAPSPAEPAAQVQYRGRNTVYRHMLPIIKLSSCPPPINLLQTCKQLRDENCHYHFATCVLEIDVTKAFHHVSFFQETLLPFIELPFSPLEKIRKIELVFAWDSEWLASKTIGSTPEIDEPWFFEIYLNDRVEDVIKFVSAAPELRNLTINWHDTERTPASEALMHETLAKFSLVASSRVGTSKPIEVIVKEYFSTKGTSHSESSVLGQRRAEFESILPHLSQPNGVHMVFR